MRRTTPCWPVLILLDENLPVDLAVQLTGHQVDSVAGAGWTGIQNGRLLRLADERYEAFITMDRSLEHQQNLALLSLRIVLLRAPSNRMLHLRPLIPFVLEALRTIQPGELVSVGA
jgi:hypothetical protein